MKANRAWNRETLKPIKTWCHVYTDRDSGETIKVKGDSDGCSRDGDLVLFGSRNHPDIVNCRLRYEGFGFVNVTGFESAKTVPAFSYTSVDG